MTNMLEGLSGSCPRAWQRRHWLAVALSATWLTPKVGLASEAYEGAQTPRPMQFPRDHGAHPQTAIEWWYLTGALELASAKASLSTHKVAPVFGFQITFFRSRVPVTQSMNSAFAAKQLVFAHAAVTDLKQGRLHHDQRIARVSGHAQTDLASYSQDDTALKLQDWSLMRNDAGYSARAKSLDFDFALALTPSQPVLLQGASGWSRKGPLPHNASHYYSVPQLNASGQLTLKGQAHKVSGRAWLDHEWSDALLDPQAVGWDWVGMNLYDGTALTAFRLRDRAGQSLWAGGSMRTPDGRLTVFKPGDLIMTPKRTWKSPHSAASYPVSWTLELLVATSLPAMRRFTIEALLDDQELDSRRSTGTIYWEGLSTLLDDSGQTIGQGYLEMTGYAAPLDL